MAFFCNVGFFNFPDNVTGLANACFFGNGLVMVGTYFKRWRSMATGLGLTGASVGTFVMPILLEALLETYSLAGTILIMSAIYLNGCICGALFRPLSFYSRSPGRRNPSVQELEPITKPEKEEAVMQASTEETWTEIGNEAANMEGEVELKKGLLAENQTKGDPTEPPAKAAPPARPMWRFRLCGRQFTFPVIIHFTVLKMPVVIFFTLFSFLVFIGYFNFILFLPPDVLSRGITSFEKAALVSYTGAGDLVGRVLVGFLGDLTIIRRYKILATSAFLCGVNIILFEVAGQVYWWMAIHAALYGLFGGCYIAINTIVLIDMVGLEMMPKTLGVVLLIQGLGAAIGQPIEGKSCLP